MARLYHVDIARHVASADRKWVDNLLSHHAIPGVDGGRQGSARRITSDGIACVALVRRLTLELELSVASAVRLADRLLGAGPRGLSIGDGLELRLDLAEFRAGVDRAIADGVESITPVRRGRPRKLPSVRP